MLTLQEIVQRLRQRGHRATGPRRAILAAVAQREDRFSAADLEESIGGSNVISRATLFRTLDLLVESGLVERVHTGNEGRDAYVVAAQAHHHHLICSRCGNVTEVLGCLVESLVERLAEEAAFRVEGHWLEITGVCSACQVALGT
jgi:Fe2+ or Zn2+ uptake regulation protein